jgi:hypothetical protein
MIETRCVIHVLWFGLMVELIQRFFARAEVQNAIEHHECLFGIARSHERPERAGFVIFEPADNIDARIRLKE